MSIQNIEMLNWDYVLRVYAFLIISSLLKRRPVEKGDKTTDSELPPIKSISMCINNEMDGLTQLV